MLSIRQGVLAQTVGISSSYLNLIEHNRRRIGGKVLIDLANALDVDPTLLSEGVEGALLDTLREAADDHDMASEDLTRLEEFVGRFPDLADLLVSLYRRSNDLDRAVGELSDRLTHDPFLSASMHAVLSNVTAIRSTASILRDTPDIDPEWRGRFQRNIHEESVRLAESADALVQYLDADSGDAGNVTATTPQEELDTYLASHEYHLSALETGQGTDHMADASQLKSTAGQSLANDYFDTYRKDVAAMPLDQVQSVVTTEGMAPMAIAQRFNVDLISVFRRLASVASSVALGPIGLVICDASGTLTFRKPIDGFPLPRYGAACPLWPLYQSLTQPSVPLRRVVAMGGRNPKRFLTYAISQPSLPTAFDHPPVIQAAMLILPDTSISETLGVLPEITVGTSCRICSHANCAARREPSILAQGI
jgi:predicted transcriptional regulator/transcriptional regulator with XRE-family HTH domain